ncbi:YidB family protein [Paraherbaspirillum soli]|uniref:YidB family protein n=1 Tax=Paraherbaspirillum soli TaxID=631222 RepID=A0ABW0MCB2_9BURK
MGLLDSVLGALGNGQQQANDPKALLIQAALSMLTSQSAGQATGGAGSGGLGGLLSAFEGAGLGQLAQSWIGNGQNQAVSAEQVQQALGGGHLEQLAQAAGISPAEAASHLSGILPDLVNQLTPHGEASAPAGGFGDLAGLLGGLLGGDKKA